MRPVVTTALTGLLLATVTAPHAAAATVPEVPVDPDRTVFTDNPRIVDQHPARVESWSRNGEGLRVNFTAGTPQCYGAHVVATESAETVTVELSVGTRPRPPTGCASRSRSTRPWTSRCSSHSATAPW